jgi:hypothetical protein
MLSLVCYVWHSRNLVWHHTVSIAGYVSFAAQQKTFEAQLLAGIV